MASLSHTRLPLALSYDTFIHTSLGEQHRAVEEPKIIFIHPCVQPYLPIHVSLLSHSHLPRTFTQNLTGEPKPERRVFATIVCQRGVIVQSTRNGPMSDAEL